MDSEKLIELVREHQGLYDLNHPKYCDAAWKDKDGKRLAKNLINLVSKVHIINYNFFFFKYYSYDVYFIFYYCNWRQL